MVAFETLLLGIVTGLGPVRLMVAAPVASVELRLDGAAVGVLRGSPWAMVCDFGHNPMPHELTAIGRDAAGHEVARATQWANLGGEQAKVSAILERDPATRRPVAVQVAWNTIEAVQPQAVTATLDEKVLPATDAHRIPLPTVELNQPHLVSVEAVFSPQLRGRADLAFGGDVIDRAETELTAVAVTLAPKQRALDVPDVQGVFSAGAGPLAPIAVDEGRAEVAVVVDQSAKAALAAHPKDWESRSGLEWSTTDGGGPVGAESLPSQSGPMNPAADRFFGVITVPSHFLIAGGARTYYRMLEPMKLSWLSTYSMLEWFAFARASDQNQAISDAVAVAASELAASNHRRALVLVLAEPQAARVSGDAYHDDSTYDVAAVKKYLAALDVPLTVWSLTGSDPGPLTVAWGPAVATRDRWEMQAQAKRLEKALALQRIVWFAGRHLPQRITLDESKTALRFAR